MTVSSVVLFWLISVCLADAAPRRGTSGPLCDPQTPAARKLPRHPKSFGGPLKLPSKRAVAGLSDITASVRRATRADLTDDPAAIQNDAPAAGPDIDSGLTPSLRPLGLFIGSLDMRPRSRAFSPRSPRGPPLSA
jgi:hypothetical protein